MLGIHGIHRETKKGNPKNACVRDYISFNLIETTFATGGDDDGKVFFSKLNVFVFDFFTEKK